MDKSRSAGSATGQLPVTGRPGEEASFDRIRMALAAAATSTLGGPDQRALLLAVLDEVRLFSEAHPGVRNDELRAMQQIAAGALVID